MTKLQLSNEDIAVLNTKNGLRHLFADDPIDVPGALARTKYDLALTALQEQLISVQKWAISENQRIVIIFEGRDAAGKGGAIRQIAGHINPRHYRIVALPKPTPEEEGEWYFQRYIRMLPGPGQIVFFDRSWYNRAIVEPVNGFCTDAEYHTFMGQVNDFERMQVESGTHVIKLYFSISRKEQAKRFDAIKNNPLARWKMSDVDKLAQDLWDEYTAYKDLMFNQTDTKIAPWKVIDANDTYAARLQALQYILETIPWQEVDE